MVTRARGVAPVIGVSKRALPVARLVIARTTIKPGSPVLFQDGCQIKSRPLQVNHQKIVHTVQRMKWRINLDPV